MSRVLKILALILVGAAIAFAISSAAFDRFLQHEFASDIARMERGDSRLSLDFDSADDLIVDAADGLRDVAASEGILRANVPNGQANVRLNLRGRWIDARRFDYLIARIEVSAPAEMVLIFDEPGELVQNAVKVDLIAGWNELKLPLMEMPWRRGREQEGELFHTVEPWGGVSGAVGEFRLYIAGVPDTRLAIDHVRFSERLVVTGITPVRQPLKRIEWIDVATLKDRLAVRQPLRAQPELRVGVRLPVWQDTPERLLLLRDAARERDAEVLFYPSLRTLPEDHRTLTSSSATDVPLSLVIAVATALLLVRLGISRLPQRGGALIALAAGMAPWIWVMLGRHFDAEPGPNVWAVIALSLLFMLTLVRYADLKQWIGNRAAWDSMLTWTLPIALLIACAGLIVDHIEWQQPGRMLGYVPFVILQQLVLVGFLLPFAQRASAGGAWVLAAALFGLMHIPNFALTLFAAIGAALWCLHFTRHRAIAPLIVSHVILGLCAVTFAPSAVLYSAEAGARFFLLQ